LEAEEVCPYVSGLCCIQWWILQPLCHCLVVHWWNL
jgi:hypothetical protein